jgi:hypothetical protein
MAATKYGHIEMVRTLIEAWANVNAKVSGGGAALWMAAI